MNLIRRERDRATSLHVDLVKNEWAAGLQVRVACVEAADHDRVHISHASPEYVELLQKPIVSPIDGQCIYLEKTGPEEAFPLLARLYSNDYFFVTQPHEDTVCEFRHSPTLGMSVRSAQDGSQSNSRT